MRTPKALYSEQLNRTRLETSLKFRGREGKTGSKHCESPRVRCALADSGESKKNHDSHYS